VWRSQCMMEAKRGAIQDSAHSPMDSSDACTTRRLIGRSWSRLLLPGRQRGCAWVLPHGVGARRLFCGAGSTRCRSPATGSTRFRAASFLRTRDGGPFTPESFSNQFSDWSKRAGIVGQASPHTLRKAAARRLAEAGCTVHEIAAITGHDSLSEIENYTQAAGQEALAKRAMQQLQNPKGSPPPQS
jgi:hypothetical protein